MPAQPAATAPAKSTDLHQLHNTIEFIDSISQEGCAEIIAIAKLTLAFLERDDSLQDTETVSHAIHAIWSKAAGMENDINAQAGELGCGHTRRRSIV
jgi:hypothetical protein